MYICQYSTFRQFDGIVTVISVLMESDHFNLGSAWPNIWYVSDDGSDANHCHVPTVPCKNLQTVLDRAAKMYGDDAQIYVTSTVLTLAHFMENKVSFMLSSFINKPVVLTAGRVKCFLKDICLGAFI